MSGWKFRNNWNLGKNCYACSKIGITKEYGDFLIGEINRGVSFQNLGVLRVENLTIGNTEYFLLK